MTKAQTITDPEAQALIRRTGDRVRAARQRRGMTRKVLSETSGVSPRYLAQLEGGEGNISIGLLHRVATALGHPVEWFLVEDDPWTSDTARLGDLFRAADTDTQGKVLRLLGQGDGNRGQRICLVGLRGAGKSTLGQAVAQALGIPFVELNRAIADRTGMPVAEIIALYGQEGYRQLEAQALDALAEDPGPMILAVAGGIVSEAATWTNLLDRFHTIWLRAQPQEHMDRVQAQGDTRPMAGNPEAMAQLRSILTSREAVYARAGASLDTSGRGVDQSTADLIQLIRDNGYLT